MLFLIVFTSKVKKPNVKLIKLKGILKTQANYRYTYSIQLTVSHKFCGFRKHRCKQTDNIDIM